MSTFISPADTKYHGLLNLGVTSCLNSVLQVLFMTKEFEAAVERNSYDTECIDSHLKILFGELRKREASTYNIIKQLGIKTVYEQRDAAGCFEKILNSLTRPEASQIFHGHLTQNNRCSTCGNETNPSWFLPLKLDECDRKDFSVGHGIEAYCRGTDIKNQMYCGNCGARSNATMKCVINHPPEVLAVKLMRFKFNSRNNTLDKNSCSVDVPYTVQIPEDQTYELYAFVEHTGNMISGNYTATIKSQDDENWYEFDDTRVTLLNKMPRDGEKFLKSKSAYLLFYKKKTREIHTAMEDFHLTLSQEKCYDTRDPTLKFVDREDDLDFLCECFQSRRALMSCGHAVTPMSLTNWCRRLLDQGESRFVCGQSGCDVQWSYEEVCKMALLTPDEKEHFEKTMASHAARCYFDIKPCPGCKTSVVRQNESDLNVRCTLCTAKKGTIYEFCWQCLMEWKGPSSDRCGNYGCTNKSLELLRTCPIIYLEDVEGVPRCPSIRACPTCGTLLERDKTRCKYVACPRCRMKFCFMCLKRHRVCRETSSYFIQCSSDVAPRQTSIPVWKKK